MNILNRVAKKFSPAARKLAESERLKSEIKAQLDRVYRMGYQVGYLDGRARRPSKLERKTARRNGREGRR